MCFQKKWVGGKRSGTLLGDSDVCMSRDYRIDHSADIGTSGIISMFRTVF
jgi:hypothetical protein